MNIDSIISDLLEIASPSGFEDKIREYVKMAVSPHVDSVMEDVRGNLICKKFSSAPNAKTIALIAHYDQVGMIVTHIEESGLVRFASIGVIDTQLQRGHVVQILHKGTIIRGVIGALPSNMRKDFDRKDTDASDLWIDLGTKSRVDTQALVSVGDPIIWESPKIFLSNNLLAGCACDNKAGVTALIKIAEMMRNQKPPCNVITIFSSKEEVGFRGISTAIIETKPDVSIVIDNGHATDYPLVKKAKYGNVEVGSGCIIPITMDCNHEIQEMLLHTCIINKIKSQCIAISEPTGTDANAIEKSGVQCKIGMVLIPCRYMHSPIEIVSMDDIDSVSNLLVSFCKSYIF